MSKLRRLRVEGFAASVARSRRAASQLRRRPACADLRRPQSARLVRRTRRGRVRPTPGQLTSPSPSASGPRPVGTPQSRARPRTSRGGQPGSSPSQRDAVNRWRQSPRGRTRRSCGSCKGAAPVRTHVVPVDRVTLRLEEFARLCDCDGVVIRQRPVPGQVVALVIDVGRDCFRQARAKGSGDRWRPRSDTEVFRVVIKEDAERPNAVAAWSTAHDLPFECN